MTALRRDRAVVLGGGIAGLLAARVLSDHFAVVELVDRARWTTAWSPGEARLKHVICTGCCRVASRCSRTCFRG